MTGRNFRYDLEYRYPSRVRYPCTFFNISLFIFLNEIQGKAFVIHLSFEERNRFYIDCFPIVNVRQLYLSWPAGSLIQLPNFRLNKTNLEELKEAK